MTDGPDRTGPESAHGIEPELPEHGTASGRVIGGVAVDLAGRLGVDPLWPRLVFVGLALFGGLGIIVYAGLWLMLIAARRSGWSVLRYVGGAVLLVGCAFVLSDGRSDLIDGPLALAALLTGIAVALWQPHYVPALVDWRSQPDETADGPPAGAPAGRAIRRTLDWRRRRRPRSVLGRAVLGAAFLTAGGLALIDELNGGRLHPEQWLGTAAAVCGTGTLIGAWRGRALWLVLPSLLFAGSGYVAGHVARAGVQTWRWGDAYYWIGADGQTLPVQGDPGRVIGSAYLYIDDVPATPRELSLRTGIGDVVITLDDDVTLEVLGRLHDGRISVDDVDQPTTDNRTTLVLGPDGPSDVTVNVAISSGDIRVVRTEITPTREPRRRPAAAPFVEDTLSSRVVGIGEGLMMGSDGTVLLPGPDKTGPLAGAISPTGTIWASADSQRRPDGVTVVTGAATEFEYLVLPNQMVITPSGVLVDVPAARAELLDDATQPGAVPGTAIDGREE